MNNILVCVVYLYLNFKSFSYHSQDIPKLARYASNLSNHHTAVIRIWKDLAGTLDLTFF